jgi:hypothetical protein
MYKSVMMCYQPPPVFAGTERLISFRETISEFLRRDQKGLVIMNTAARRFLLSFAYAIEDPVDIKIARADNMGLDLSDISNLKDYDVVFVVNFYVPYETESFFSTEDLKSISGYLTKRGFRPIEPAELWLEAGRSSLLVFGK